MNSLFTVLKFYGVLAVPVFLFSITGLAAPKAPVSPPPPDPCPLSIRQIGPRVLRLGSATTLLLRIENKSSCNLSSATIRNILPKRTKFRRSDPIPTLVQKNPAPAGTELSWSNAKFAPGEVLLIDVGMYIRGNSGRIGLNRVCVVHPSLLAGITCKNFKIEIIP